MMVMEGTRTRNHRIDSPVIWHFRPHFRRVAFASFFPVFQGHFAIPRYNGGGSRWRRIDQCRYQIITKSGPEMAGLQCRSGSWRVLFWYKGKLHTFWIGEDHTMQMRTS
jgi:hypothetical protein